MENTLKRKKRIINDPIHGFIHIPSGIIYDLVEHSYFQRLRRIKQLGLTYLVYPGAFHTRFQHAIGATHLMGLAINTLRSKGHNITDEEACATQVAILIHDIGHGPFSHALEYSIVNGITHERISGLFMERLNSEFNGQMELALKIFKNSYPKRFLNQLVSGQLDMDRLDYLQRDSFFAGVPEGTVGAARIIKMLEVRDDKLVIESKGIYSVEKFLIARRLMYWQVYLHKTVLAAEEMLMQILRRAKYLAEQGTELFATPALKFFLYHNVGLEEFKEDCTVLSGKTVLDIFSELDDNDIMTSIKVWSSHTDKVLSLLCNCIIKRKLFRIEISNNPFSEEHVMKIKNHIRKTMHLNQDEIDFFVVSNSISNNAYSFLDDQITILYNDNNQVDIGEASEILNTSMLSQTEKKFYLCYFKN